MTELSIIAFVTAAMVAFGNWRTGLFLTVVVGLLQDPFRKVAPGQPLYFVVLSAVVFAAACAGAHGARISLLPKSMPGWQTLVGRPFDLFVWLLVLQAIHSLALFGNIQMTGIGLMVWLTPFPAMMLAYQFSASRGLAGVQRWMTIYVLGVVLFSVTIYMQFSGVTAPAIGEVGEGLLISSFGGQLAANSGLFRSSEIAAWHTAAASCLVLTLLISKRLNLERLVLALAIIAFLVSMGVLTGRRKMLVEVAFFLALYFLVHSWYQSRGWRQVISLGLVVGTLFLSVAVESGNDVNQAREVAMWRQNLTGSSNYDSYALRGSTAFEDIPKRIEDLGIAPVVWAVDSLGWFGSGLGTGSQSTGGNDDNRRNIGAAEGGLGKIVVELGVPGLVLVAWLAWRLLKFTNQTLGMTTSLSSVHARIAYGIVAFLGAKASSFSVATQAFSDPFVLLVLGICLGFLYAMPYLAWQSVGAAHEMGNAHAHSMTTPRTA